MEQITVESILHEAAEAVAEEANRATYDGSCAGSSNTLMPSPWTRRQGTRKRRPSMRRSEPARPCARSWSVKTMLP